MKLRFKLSNDLEPIPNDNQTLSYISNKNAGDIIEVEVKDKQRTTKQNGCLHEYLSDLSNALNEAGYDVKTTITAPVSFTPETVKKHMFHKIMKALYPDKTSTRQLSTVEVGEVYENLNRLTAERFGISLVWPSRFR